MDRENKISSITNRKVVYAEDVIKALRNCPKHNIDLFDSYQIDIQDAEYTIAKLPPAQPDSIRCEDCKYWEGYVGTIANGHGDCKFHEAHFVTSNGYCFWAERRTDDER